MKIKKITVFSAIMVLCIFLIAVVIYLNCQPETKIKTQGEFQMELLDKLYKIALLPNKNLDLFSDGKNERITEGFEINSEIFILYSHCYKFFRAMGNTTEVEDVVTIEDLIRLYDVYDEALEKKFLALYDWIRVEEGEYICMNYAIARNTALTAYKDKYGHSFYARKQQDSSLTMADMIEFEQFIRDNPDFMPKEVYYKELYNMRIISSEEYHTFEDAAKKTQNGDTQE